MAALKVRMSEARLVTPVGAPGVGKTRLATELAAMSRRAFPDGVWMADLASLDDPEKVPQAVLSALNVAEPTGGAPRAAALHPLADKLVEVD
jgi:predicted ATPase